ncbi:MAG: hypothetical protein HOP17_03060 [Acidobacteria bacterium]|nr:hypothetical protein [Acidobacteriota bacterium]
MSNRNTRIAIFTIFILLFGTGLVSAQTITGSLADGKIARGARAKGTIVLSIPAGLHVNSNKPNSEYLIATTVKITGVGFKVASVNYPKGIDRKFQFSEEQLNVYEGEIKVPFSITIPRTFHGKTLSVKALVRYQACTNEVCYPPRNKEVVMTAAVR